MTEWLNDGDVVITGNSMKYFINLINFVKFKDLESEFKDWEKFQKH